MDTIEASGLKDLHQFAIRRRGWGGKRVRFLTCDLRAAVWLIRRHYFSHWRMHCLAHLWLNSTFLHPNCFITMIIHSVWKIYRSRAVRNPCLRALWGTTRTWLAFDTPHSPITYRPALQWKASCPQKHCFFFFFKAPAWHYGISQNLT